MTAKWRDKHGEKVFEFDYTTGELEIVEPENGMIPIRKGKLYCRALNRKNAIRKFKKQLTKIKDDGANH